jgi:1-acyl-sn-glycerol-3-phosphate acyltransferase
MLGFLPPPLLGVLVFTLMILNTILASCLIILSLPLRLLPGTLGSRHVPSLMMWFAQNWATIHNRCIYRLLPRIEWDIDYPPGLDRKGWYMISANHQSWVDIMVLYYVFNRRIPFLKYFLKQDLLWIPFLGAALWCMDFPFMKRYSKQLLERRPELKGKDMETTRRSCARFEHTPVSIINFLEGTRSSPAKRAQQHSPYRHLLKPKAGGIAFVLSALGERMHCLLDVTIIYPGGIPSFWQFASGRVRRIEVRITVREIPADCFSHDYETDVAFRESFQTWVAGIWAEKDLLLDQTTSSDTH